MINPWLQPTCVEIFPVPSHFEFWLHSHEIFNVKSLFTGFPIGFRDPRLGLFEDRDPGIYSKKGARCGIVTVNGTRESVILRGGIRESITSTLQEPEVRWREFMKKQIYVKVRKSLATQLLYGIVSQFLPQTCLTWWVVWQYTQRIFTRFCINYKDPLCTVLNYTRHFGDAAKEGLKGTTW